jgi:hypothetical protein
MRRALVGDELNAGPGCRQAGGTRRVGVPRELLLGGRAATSLQLARSSIVTLVRLLP